MILQRKATLSHGNLQIFLQFQLPKTWTTALSRLTRAWVQTFQLKTLFLRISISQGTKLRSWIVRISCRCLMTKLRSLSKMCSKWMKDLSIFNRKLTFQRGTARCLTEEPTVLTNIKTKRALTKLSSWAKTWLNQIRQELFLFCRWSFTSNHIKSNLKLRSNR